MKHLQLFLLIIGFTQCFAQERLLIDSQLITDWSRYPVYSKLVQEEDAGWKPEYQYMDSIQVFWITYMSDGLKVKGLLVKPKKDGKHPSVIFNRGGNREFGSLKAYHGAITLGQIARHGYVVIASQYRGNMGGEGIEEFGGQEVNDILNLTEVLNEVEGADAKNIGMYGWSRGGMMTYIALTKTDKVKAAVVGGALSDCYSMINDRPAMETNVLAELIPNYEANREKELNKRSAVKWADKFSKDVPILMLHGNADWRVKPEQSLQLAMEFEKYRVPYRLVMFEGGDHGISEHRAEVTEQVTRWFDRFLKNGEPVPEMEYHGK